MASVKVSDNLCGIYKIQHINSGRIYIGQSINCYHRLHRHISDLKYRRHSNRALQNAHKKYGVDAFCFEQILACSAENLSLYESLLIGEYKANIKPFGYNFRDVVDSSAGIRFESKVYLAGSKYGMLTLIRRDLSKKNTHWICRCDCGKEKSINVNDAKFGKTVSCGCYKKSLYVEMFTKHKVGDRNGMLKLIEIVGHNKFQQKIGLFKCDCGSTVNVAINSVMGGNTKSCGCYKTRFVILDGEKVSCLEAAKRLGISSGSIIVRARQRNETHQQACDHFAAGNKRKMPFVVIDGEKMSITSCAKKYGFHKTSVRFRMKYLGESHQTACDHFVNKKRP